MKKLVSVIAMLAMAATVFTACNKNDDEPEANYMQVGSKTYTLTEADPGLNGIYDGLAEFCFEIWSENAYINFCNLHCDTDGTSIKEGTYVSSDDETDMTTDKGNVWYQTIDGDDSYLADDATLTVKNHGNNVYEFWWNSTDSDSGVVVKGHFKGTLDFTQQYD